MTDRVSEKLANMTKPTMEPKKYLETQMRIFEASKIVSSLDLDTFLICLDNALAMAPAVDADLFARAQMNMKAVKRLTLISKDLKTAYDESFKAILEKSTVAFAAKPKGNK